MIKPTGRKAQPIMADIPIAQIFLWEQNPRHNRLRGEASIIEQLCEDEDIVTLARDIVTNGISPIERFALLPIKSGAKTADTYTAAEGNRRICALKLLIDPDRAPAKFRNRFTKLADGWQVIDTVPAAVFNSIADVRPWLERTHTGPQNGRGRKSWNAEQKQRFDGSGKNRMAQALLDYGQKAGLLTEAQRKGRLTTVQRFLDVKEFRETLGIGPEDTNTLLRNRSEQDFNALTQVFLADVIEGSNANSRMNKSAIKQYAESLSGRVTTTGSRITPQPLGAADPEPEVEKPKKAPRPPAPRAPKLIAHDSEIADALAGAKHQKLQSIYHSITSIDVTAHTPLLTMGLWGFMEVLTAWHGSTTAIDQYLDKNRLKQLTRKSEVKAETQAIKRVCENGNTTKHDPQAALFDAGQLVNDMITLTPVIRALAKEAAAKLSAGRE